MKRGCECCQGYAVIGEERRVLGVVFAIVEVFGFYATTTTTVFVRKLLYERNAL
jgi:hypothetical protein